MTRSNKQGYTYTEFKDITVQKVQKYYGYDVASSLRGLQQYDMEIDRPTRISIMDTDTNTKETYQIGLEMIYQ